MSHWRQLGFSGLLLLSTLHGLQAQDLEPRRWTHLPVGATFTSLAYSHIDSDIQFDPSLEIEDASSENHVIGGGLVHVFDVFGRTGRIDILVDHSNARWDGLLEGLPAATERNGFNDPRVRFAVNLFGSPAQRGAEFRRFRPKTIVGAALDVSVPIGEYKNDLLINLGTNSWIIRPSLGIVHHWGKWAAELTSSVWFYTDNDKFRGHLTRKRDPLVGVQTHLIYTFRPGLWLSLSGAYGSGARSRIDGVRINDNIQKSLVALSLGLPITPTQGFKVAYIRGDTHQNTGDDSDQLLLVYSKMWGVQ